MKQCFSIESVDAFAAYKSDHTVVPAGSMFPYDIVLTNLHNGYDKLTGKIFMVVPSCKLLI